MSKGDDTKYKREQKPAFNGIVKLASLLQKALETGRSNYIEMSEVNRYISYYVKTQIDESSAYVDYILNNSKNGMEFKRLRNDFVKVFEEISKTTLYGYEKLVAPNGGVNKSSLEQLIEIDTEITATMNIIRNGLRNGKVHGKITHNEVKEIDIVLKELMINLNKRKKL